MTNPLDTIEKALQEAYSQIPYIQSKGDSYATVTHDLISKAQESLRQLKAVDVEGLKIVSDSGAKYETGWNDCIDHLASRGLIRVEDVEKKREALELFEELYAHDPDKDTCETYLTIRAALGGKDEK